MCLSKELWFPGLPALRWGKSWVQVVEMASYLVTFGGGTNQRDVHGNYGTPRRASWGASPISMLVFCRLEIPVSFLAATWCHASPTGLSLLPPFSHESCYWLWCSLLSLKRWRVLCPHMPLHPPIWGLFSFPSNPCCFN